MGNGKVTTIGSDECKCKYTRRPEMSGSGSVFCVFMSTIITYSVNCIIGEGEAEQS